MRDDFRRIASNSLASRYVLHNHGTCPDSGTITNVHILHNAHTRTNVDIVANMGGMQKHASYRGILI